MIRKWCSTDCHLILLGIACSSLHLLLTAELTQNTQIQWWFSLHFSHVIALYFAYIAIEFNPLSSWNWRGSQFGPAGGGDGGRGGASRSNKQRRSKRRRWSRKNEKKRFIIIHAIQAEAPSAFSSCNCIHFLADLITRNAANNLN